jgi:hypothetical protein
MGIFDLLSNGSGGGRKNGIQTTFIGKRGLRLFWFFQANNFWRMERFMEIGPFNGPVGKVRDSGLCRDDRYWSEDVME